MKHIIFLKIYFFLLLGFLGAFFVPSMLEYESITFIDYIAYLFEFVFLLGVFGYAFGKKIFVNRLWQIFLPLVITWDIFFLIHIADLSVIEHSTFKFFGFSLVYFILLLPGYIALYLYGYQNEKTSVKRSIKVLLLIMFFVVVTNAITYKLTYDYINMKLYLLNTKLDVYALKAYDQNNTIYLDIVMNGNIDSVLYQAGNIDDIEKYKSLCEVFDKELFEIVDRCHHKNIERYGPYKDKEVQNIRLTIEKGKVNMKRLCNVQE